MLILTEAGARKALPRNKYHAVRNAKPIPNSASA